MGEKFIDWVLDEFRRRDLRIIDEEGWATRGDELEVYARFQSELWARIVELADEAGEPPLVYLANRAPVRTFREFAELIVEINVSDIARDWVDFENSNETRTRA